MKHPLYLRQARRPPLTRFVLMQANGAFQSIGNASWYFSPALSFLPSLATLAHSQPNSESVRNERERMWIFLDSRVSRTL